MIYKFWIYSDGREIRATSGYFYNQHIDRDPEDIYWETSHTACPIHEICCIDTALDFLTLSRTIDAVRGDCIDWNFKYNIEDKLDREYVYLGDISHVSGNFGEKLRNMVHKLKNIIPWYERGCLV
ncbi:MAG: hypothetical protein ACOC5T_01015 [Elusimicrobiota bacterium]